MLDHEQAQGKTGHATAMEDEMDKTPLETRPLTLPVYYWKHIEAQVEILDYVYTPEEWIRRLIRSQFSYSEDPEGGGE